MISETIPEIAKLTREEKLQLAGELWEENIDRISSPETEEAIEKLLRERLKEYEANPDAVISWEELRKKNGLDP